MKEIPAAIDSLLLCPTPREWVEAALHNLDILLMDHANCEKKAAATAVNLMFQYGDRHPDIQETLSKLAREELRHFEQVAKIMRSRGIAARPLSASRYAEGLRRHLRKREPERLVDLFIIGSLIEARSCERFRALAPVLDPELSEFYRGLAAAESRHFLLYSNLAAKYSMRDTAGRIREFAEIEAELIGTKDSYFRFHSGVPMNVSAVVH